MIRGPLFIAALGCCTGSEDESIEIARDSSTGTAVRIRQPTEDMSDLEEVIDISVIFCIDGEVRDSSTIGAESVRGEDKNSRE